MMINVQIYYIFVTDEFFSKKNYKKWPKERKISRNSLLHRNYFLIFVI